MEKYSYNSAIDFFEIDPTALSDGLAYAEKNGYTALRIRCLNHNVGERYILDFSDFADRLFVRKLIIGNCFLIKKILNVDALYTLRNLEYLSIDQPIKLDLLQFSNLKTLYFTGDNKLKNIDINKIQANENQPRTVFNEEKIEELAASIKENGLIQPIVVRKVNGIYQIIAGERRYRACCSLNMKQVPCIIEDYDDKQTQTLAIIENIQREDLSPLEEAKAYQALIKEYGYSQTELADIVGKKQSTIANKLRLLKLSDDVQFSLNQKQITERHARAMLSLNEEKQQEVLREVLKKKLTVADTERLIKKEPKPKKKKASADVKKTISRNVKIALNTLQQAIGMIEKTGTSLQQETEDLEDEYVITIRIHK